MINPVKLATGARTVHTHLPAVGVNAVGGAVESRTAKVGRRCIYYGRAATAAKRREPSTTVKVYYYYYRHSRRRRRYLFRIINFFPVVRIGRARPSVPFAPPTRHSR